MKKEPTAAAIIIITVKDNTSLLEMLSEEPAKIENKLVVYKTNQNQWYKCVHMSVVTYAWPQILISNFRINGIYIMVYYSIILYK